MRLIARAPVARPSIHPLPAPPPSLPPIPEKQALKTKPVIKKNQGGHKTGAHKKSCRIAAAKAAAPE
jgi:hypothetical protein